MTIKRDEDYVLKVIVTLLCVIGLGFVYVVGLKVSFGIFLAIHTPAFLFLFILSVSYGRTFVLSQEGVTVRFWWFQKQYLWSELKTKRIENYPKFTIISSRGDCPYKKGAMFSPRQIRKPRWMRPMMYSCFHPWSYVYVNFHIPDPATFSKRRSGASYYLGRHYEVHEAEFREKMRQWHVELEEQTL